MNGDTRGTDFLLDRVGACHCGYLFRITVAFALVISVASCAKKPSLLEFKHSVGIERFIYQAQADLAYPQIRRIKFSVSGASHHVDIHLMDSERKLRFRVKNDTPVDCLVGDSALSCKAQVNSDDDASYEIEVSGPNETEHIEYRLYVGVRSAKPVRIKEI